MTISAYSDLNNKIILANKLDKLIKFNELDDTTIVLNNNYSIPYNEYNHKYKTVNKR